MSERPSGEIEEKIIERKPELRYMYRALDLLHAGPESAGEEKHHWAELYKEVPLYNGALELSDNIRETVRAFVAEKIPRLKERIPSLAEINDGDFLEALVDNWFEKIPEVEGQRREVLMAVMSHMVNRIENTAYRNILANANDADLEKLGIDGGIRDLTVDLLKASEKADPLFIRFLAYAQLSGKPPKEASPTALFVENDSRPHTFAELFPHETASLGRNLRQIVENSGTWEGKKGGKIFKSYLDSLGAFFLEKNSEEAERYFKEVQRYYKEVIESGFSVLVTPPTEGYYKKPYLDPELRISLATKDSMEEEFLLRHAQSHMAETLGQIGLERFEDATKRQPLRSVIALGSFGVNLMFNAAAQEKPAIVLYLNEQIRSYDREFPGFLEKMISNTGEAFEDVPPEERKGRMERMSRMNTMLHEFGHSALPDGSPESERLGREPLTKIDEIKADILFRALFPFFIEKGGVEGTKEQWAVASIGSALQDLRDNPKGDPYYHTAVYALNDAMEAESVRFENGKITIIDTEAYYKNLRNAARELIALYENPSTTESKAARWIRTRCRPNEKLAVVEQFLKEKNEKT